MNADEATNGDRTLNRIMLWSAPRCTSTLFEHMMRLLPGVHGLHEPFSCAFYLGEQRSSPRYTKLDPMPGFRWSEVLSALEADYANARAVFVKDMAYAIEGDYSRLPRGYQHTFLIRDPRASVKSLYRLICSEKAPEWSDFIALEVGLVDLLALYEHVCDGDPTPTIIDSADLLAEPAATMRNYCAAVGLEYSESMLSWDPAKASEQWEMWGTEWYETLMTSTGIKPTQRRGPVDITDLPAVIRASVEDSIPAYEYLCERRLRVNP